MNAALRALNRFGLGARPGEAGGMRDPQVWLTAQLDGPPPLLQDPSLPTPQQLSEALRDLRAAQVKRDPDSRKQAQVTIRDIAAAEAHAALSERVRTERPFVERLVAFWSNHLCVSAAAKVAVVPLAGAYEREVIRPHVLGRFEDMVLASARHPAMLLYLDNIQSIGPNSPAGKLSMQRQPGRGRGLNENYARELMELHTVGVNGGYAQEDVTSLARVLTGWTNVGIDGGAAPRISAALRRGAQATDGDGFAFLPGLHEPGAQTVRDVRYSQSGVEQGEAAIRDLCASPAAAHFIATKLVRHFVADDPPSSAVDRVAAAYTSSRGNLKEVAQAVAGLPEAWDPAHRKIRTPQDWLIAVIRSTGTKEAPEQMMALTQQLRHPLWRPSSPKGFGDTVNEWADSDSLMNRAELARTVGNRADGKVDPAAVARLIDMAPQDPLFALITDESIEVSERLALVIAGPAFQWR